MFEGAKPLPKNAGWRCGLCAFKVVGEFAGAQVRWHIKKEHPDKWAEESWSMSAIKEKKKGR